MILLREAEAILRLDRSENPLVLVRLSYDHGFRDAMLLVEVWGEGKRDGDKEVKDLRTVQAASLMGLTTSQAEIDASANRIVQLGVGKVWRAYTGPGRTPLVGDVYRATHRDPEHIGLLGTRGGNDLMVSMTQEWWELIRRGKA